MNACKGAMNDFDFLSDFRLVLLLDNINPLLKGRVAQHSELHHLPVGDLYREVCIPMFQNVKGCGTLCQQRTQLRHRHLKLYKHVIMNDRNQDPTGFKIVTRQFFRVPHRDKTRQAFLLQEVTHDHFMSVEGARI